METYLQFNMLHNSSVFHFRIAVELFSIRVMPVICLLTWVSSDVCLLQISSAGSTPQPSFWQVWQSLLPLGELQSSPLPTHFSGNTPHGWVTPPKFCTCISACVHCEMQKMHKFIYLVPILVWMLFWLICRGNRKSTKDSKAWDPLMMMWFLHFKMEFHFFRPLQVVMCQTNVNLRDFESINARGFGSLSWWMWKTPDDCWTFQVYTIIPLCNAHAWARGCYCCFLFFSMSYVRNY